MWPLIGISRPTQSRRGADAGRGRLVVARRDPVVDDLEALLVEALGVGEVPREPARDRDLNVGQARDGAVAEREAAALAELVEAVLGREPHRHRGERAGDLPVGVGVDEVGVEDRSAARGRGSRRPSRTRAGRRRAERWIASTGTPRASSSRAKSQAPGSSSCSISRRTSQPRLRRSGSSESRCASDPEIPATFCMWRISGGFTPPAPCRPRSRRSGAPRPPRAARARSPTARAAGSAANAREPLGELVRVLARERVEELVEDRIRGDHRQAARGGLVDDLVGARPPACC